MPLFIEVSNVYYRSLTQLNHLVFVITLAGGYILKHKELQELQASWPEIPVCSVRQN